MNNSYKLSDNVISRIAQILQEGILLGIDIVDLLRQVEVCVDPDGSTLSLSPEYARRVVEMHKKLIEDLEAKKQQTEAQKFAEEVAGKKTVFS